MTRVRMARALLLSGLLAGLIGAGVVGLACSSAELNDQRVPDEDAGEDPGVDGGVKEDGKAVQGDAPSVGPVPVTTDLRILVEPGAKLTDLLTSINGAKKSIHVTIYLLTSSEVIDALIAQRKAGREVQVVLNQNFPDGSNQTTVYNQLKAGGVGVVWATPSLNFTHSKCVILDATEAWIMTMNITESSPFQNREYLAVVHDAADVAQAEAVFQGDFTGVPQKATGKLLVAPVNAESSLIRLIDEATTSVDIQGESFGDYDITKALVRAKSRGAAVRVVTSDGTLTDSEKQEFATLKTAGVPIVRLSTPYVHAKAIVIDGKKAYVGSANFTYNSLTFNREIGVIVGAPAEVSKVATTIASDFTKGKPY